MKIRIIKAKFVLFTVILLVLFGFKSDVFAEEKIKIDMKVGIGEENYKYSNFAPFTFNIENKLKNIDGEIQVELINEKDELNVYSKKINIPINATKKVIISAPILKNMGKIKVKIVEEKKCLYEKELPIKNGYKSSEFFIGILSDDEENLSYLKTIKSIAIGSNGFDVKAFKLSKEDIMDFNKELSSLDVIIMNNFDSVALTLDKYNILKNWVKDGGILLIGTGSSYSKTLSVFKDDFIAGEVGSVDKVNTNLLKDILPNYKNDNKNFDLDSLNLKFNEGKVILKEGDKALGWSIKKSKGIISVTSFDLGKEPIKNWPFKEQFLTKLIENSAQSSEVNNIYSKKEGIDIKTQSLYNFREAISNIVELPLPKIWNLIVILLTYLILVSPVAYILLKKKDKREYMWIVVPSLSLAFVLIIYFTGMGTRINDNIENVINIIKIDQKGEISLKSYASIFSPKKSKLKVKPLSTMTISELLAKNDLIPYTASNYKKRDRKIQKKIVEGIDNHIEFYDNKVFNNNYLVLNYEMPKIGKIDSDISYYNEKFKGRVKNNTSMDLEDCYICMSNAYIKIGSLKASQEININAEGEVYGEIYDFLDRNFGEPSINYKNGKKEKLSMDKNEARSVVQKSNMINGFFYGEGYSIEKPVIIGFSNKSFSKDLKVNGKEIKKYEKNLVVSDINLTFRDKNVIEYPFGYFKAKLNMKNGGYDYREKIFYGTGNYETEIDIDENMDIEQINIKYELDFLKGNTEVAKQYIWNEKDNKWQIGDFRDFIINKKDVPKYLISNKRIKIKFDILEEGVRGEIPKLSVKGSAK
ncbi:hypothetical protein ACER0A_001645 [Haloimpatiens sp. FM7315]|uniref:hypothetical protein n=1 Tax=Haloimpatiens sp. FM7315 TaxID=3298609 RepID=UPI00370B67D2